MENLIEKKVHKLPKWFYIIISLLPIILWPAIFYGSVFIYDDKNADPRILDSIFIALNSYPIYLIVNTIIASKIFNRKRILSIILYTWPIVLFVVLILCLAI